MVRVTVCSCIVLFVACSDDSPPAADTNTIDSLRADGEVTDGPVSDAQPPGESGADLPPSSDAAPDGAASDGASPDAGKPQGLPFTYTRPAAGTPVTAAELTAFTDKYLDLLKQTRYFDTVDDRVHGWPESDPQKSYWYGTWWSGVVIIKKQGKVTYDHLKGGADNNGLRTGPVLEGVCYALKLWPTSTKLEHLTHRLVRGFNSWILAMERQPNDPAGVLLTRASYPVSIDSTDGGRSFKIDYSKNRPGDDNGACEYVHIAQNPHWGSLYVKNKRSKDCIGHMLRAIATMQDCSGVLGAAAQKDHAAMEANYNTWAKRVEDDGWAIASYNKQAKPWIPPDMLAHFISLGNAECTSMLAIRLFGRNGPGTLSCGNGIHPLEWIALQNNQNGEIIRSFHEAAARHALLSGQNTLAKSLLTGLALRLNEAVKFADQNNWPVHMDEHELATLIAHSANAGVPLTSKEVRWFHKLVDKAHQSYIQGTNKAVYDVFNSSTPDGNYIFSPAGTGLKFRAFAVALGSCAATYLNPASQPLLDCQRLKSTFTP